MIVFLVLIVIAALVLAEVYGTDSRDGRDWTPTGERRPPRDTVSSRL